MDKYKEFQEKLYKLYNEKDISDYIGSTKKYECDIKHQHGIFKERRSTQSKDHIMEEVAYRISIVLNVKCCEASCRRVNNLYGSFSKFEIDDTNKLVTFTQLLGSKDKSADDLMNDIIQIAGAQNSFTSDIYKVIMFDFILGQLDRHMDNISVYKNNQGKVVLYPLYDNGLCCCSPFSNDTAIHFLNNGFYSSRNGSDEEIYEALRKYRNIYKGDLRNILKYHQIDSNILSAIIDKANKYNQLSNKRKEATIRFIMGQIERIHRLNIEG